ncbi:MAG: hypothetical protein AAGH89_16950 [Verrucomicrobiota bacterium]
MARMLRHDTSDGAATVGSCCGKDTEIGLDAGSSAAVTPGDGENDWKNLIRLTIFAIQGHEKYPL